MPKVLPHEFYCTISFIVSSCINDVCIYVSIQWFIQMSCKDPDCTRVDNGWYCATTCTPEFMLSCVPLQGNYDNSDCYIINYSSSITILPMFSTALAKTKESSIGLVATEEHLNFVLTKHI